MKETTKAMRRRTQEHEGGAFQWLDIFKGDGIDIGAGDDPLPFEGCKPFDQQDGDANKLSTYFPPESQDYLHASHVLEHMHDPRAAIRDWLTLLRPGGWLVVTVPDIGAYERFTYPSTYNPDHKASFSMIYWGSRFPIHIHIPSMLAELKDVANVALSRFVERNYDWTKPDEDQTLDPEKGVEIWNEFVLQKRAKGLEYGR